MFVLLNQLSSGDPIGIDVANIKEFHPEIIIAEGGEEKTGTAVHLYRGQSWIVRQDILDVHRMCQRAKKGEI